MSRTGRDVAVPTGGASWLPIALTLAAIAAAPFLAATTASGSTGYELGKPDSTLVTGIEFPHGVAVDQVSHRVYIAVVTNNGLSQAPGEIRRFESDGDAAGIFTAGSQAFFSGVAVNPVTHGFYGSQVRVQTPVGGFGAAQMDPFSSAGVLGTPFPLAAGDTLPQIATDSTGDVYFPNAAGSVQVFNSTGVLQETITCGGCAGGAFGKPVSVALDSEDDLYVADLGRDRVVKLTSSGGSYKFDSLLQSGRGAVAVGVDPSTDDVLVGDFPNGTGYHVVAYDSSGSQFDDFGAGLFINPPLGAIATAQIAADATTHRLYLTETNKIYIFERVTISPPSATVDAASPVGQLTATLNATVNAHGHAALECEFEYTEAADTGFANATSLPCSKLPDGSVNTALSAKASGLSPTTAYRYRVTATSNGGPVTSGSESFETLPVVPATVATESPLAVTQATATLRGKVNPHGGSASSCRFEFGKSVSYGSSTSCLALPSPVTTDIAETRAISGLEPGTTYHYRLVVKTNAGTATGGDVEFTTESAPPDPEPEAKPSLPVTTTPPPVVDPPDPPPPPRCRKGFRRQTIHGESRCVKVCRKGFHRKRVHGKVRCVPVRRKRSN